ncbi:MAG: kynureninase [Phycisphaerales bacterium]|nr:kynureninase [Phycisphaerales bacterium]
MKPPASTEPCTPITSLDDARHLDAADPMRGFRDRFHIPQRNGRDVMYFCGNSLGLQPKRTRELVEAELDDWRDLAVDAHFDGQTPWYSYHETLRGPMSRIVGAREHEVVMMNSLTVNLHLMMVTFYRPTGQRTKVVMEAPAFPSDTYAIASHLRARGIDPATNIIIVHPPKGQETVGMEQFEDTFEKYRDDIALLLVGGVNYYTGQVMEMHRLTELAHGAGAVAGFDLAHAVGNVPLALHDWNVDFACWCSYKYLNGSPGAVGGCFVHERHGRNTDLARFAGWWGNDPETRFRMHLEESFHAMPTADGWQLSNPPILAMAPLRASLELFDEATMPALQARSRALTVQLRTLLERDAGRWCEIITPDVPMHFGCQLSLRMREEPEARFRALTEAGVVGDFRPPNVIRLAPTPLYNTFEDVWRCAQILTGRDAE